jgi:3-hydroxyacyl-CoA dehydrogenase/enoyl-CoA hydratase/3-hydroxybutyryl-CoA epimerase
LNHRIGEDGILRVVFVPRAPDAGHGAPRAAQRPGEGVNLLTRELLGELGRLLDGVRGRDDLRGVLFASGKPGHFIAGADVDQIAAVRDAHDAAEAARFGQSVFQKIADLGVPSACAIGGACLGGGTELALACTYRVAADDPAVRIGLPEVRLGIIPGFGGTQRLPRLVGLAASLDLILTGRTLNAKRAHKIGLVDRVVPVEYLERETLALLSAGKRADRPGTGGWLRTVEQWKPVRDRILARARSQAERKADPRHYPAPFRALEAIEAAYAHPLPQGLDVEARIIGELVPTRTSKNLIWLFKSQSAAKGSGAGLAAVPRRVERTGVVGAGIMGGGIAQLLADGDLPVRLKDVRYEAILTALRTASDIWRRDLERKRITRRELEQKLAWISPTTDDAGFAHVDVVIEAVVEKLEVKRSILAALEPRMDPRAIFATNTSSIPIEEIAARALRPERVIGMHFFNPVDRMPLVEVVRGRQTSPEAVATIHALAVRLGKVPIVVRDGPGFLVNRVLTFYVNEAVRLLSEGVSVESIDASMRAFGMPMGPFEMLDQVGLDTSLHVAGVLRAALGLRASAETGVLDRLVEAGNLGKKTGRGFYRWDDKGGKRPDPAVSKHAGSPAPRELPAETLAERMVLAAINEAALCLEEGVVREARDLDLAMVLGTGFPPFRGGLLRHADEVGIPIVADRLTRLADAHGERFRPAGLLREMVREQRRFYGS